VTEGGELVIYESSGMLELPERSFYTRYLILKCRLHIDMEEKRTIPNNIAGEGFYPVWFYYSGYYRHLDKVYRDHAKKHRPWIWKQCKVIFFKISQEKMLFVIRRERTKPFSSRVKEPWSKIHTINESKKDFKLKYVIGFDVDVTSLPNSVLEENIEEPLNDAQTEFGPSKSCWALKLGDDHLIWEPKVEEKNKESTIIYKIFEEIQRRRNDQPVSTKFFNIQLDSSITPKIYPVVFHPSKDLRGAKNYIREIHCYRETVDSNKIQVTIVFDNEQLREHKIVDQIYKLFRLLRYGRKFDVETFNLILDNETPVKYDFPDIYSKDFNIKKDNIHEDACALDIKYYFGDIRHPIIFINTANHAMAEHDANYSLWKLEYRPWEEECPIFFGNQSRCEIERRLRSFHLNPLLFLKCNNSSYSHCGGQVTFPLML
jgi:hypothetical protein